MTGPSLIAVDIGNSSTKIGWFEDLNTHSPLPAPTATTSFATSEAPPSKLGSQLPQRGDWHIASVHREGSHILTNWISTHRPADTSRLLNYQDLPISVRVDFPDRVGLDRLAAAVAVNVLRPADRPAIVIDAGSAITVDLVAADGAFEGGVILPGFRMSAKALYGADQLPLAVLAPNDEPPSVVGKNTEGAIKSGLFWGAVGAVREITDRMRAKLDQPPALYVTGGDLRQLARHLGGEARFVPNMVLSGIAIAAARR